MSHVIPEPGTIIDGDFFIAAINVNGKVKGILVPPSAIGNFGNQAWNDNWNLVEGAQSYCDGAANTIAMAEAGSVVAQQVLEKKLHIPSQDEAEKMYRILKPTAEENYLYGRSGINASAIPPTYPYTKDDPKQTTLEAFKEGGPEAIEGWIWTSTQHAGSRDSAWAQSFDDGGQDGKLKGLKLGVRAVRWIDL
jgi:hypothetical protein